MTKQVINVGISGNDKRGDKIRNAFIKVNDNFTELYDAVDGLGAADATNIQNIGAKANSALSTSNVAQDKANAAYALANAAFDKANTSVTDYSPAFNVANAAFNAANNIVIPDISSAFDIANAAANAAITAGAYANDAWMAADIAGGIANAAFNAANNIVVPDISVVSVLANDAFDVANAAFDAANNAVTDFSPAFNKANDAYDIAASAYDYANTLISENTNLTDVFNVANAAFGVANTSNTANIYINDLVDVDIDYGTILSGYVLKWDGNKWAAGVDATTGGAGTDADTLDGQDGVYYLNYNNFANTPNLLIYETKSDLAVSLTSANNYAGEMANASNAYAASLTPDLTAANNYAGFMANSVNAYASVTYVTLSSIGSYETVSNATAIYNAVNAAYTVANAAFNYANSDPDTVIWNTANAAFDKANSANVLAYNTGIGANAYASSVGVAANNYANNLIATAPNASIGNVNITYVLDSGRFTKLSGVEESFGTYNSVTGLTNFDCTNNYIFYVSPTGNFTANLQNFLLDSNNVTSVTMVLNQGSTPYMSINNILINGANTTINWQGGTAPTGTALKKDILTLSILNVNGANTVLGQLVSFG